MGRLLHHRSALTTYTRIRDAALAGFALDGVEATSVRDVARAAEVSPGLVQHHFPTKADLLDAVNEHVVSVIATQFGNVEIPPPPADGFKEFGNRIAAIVRSHPRETYYIARAVADGDEAALIVFDTLVDTSVAHIERLIEEGRADPELDVGWAALHVVVFSLGTLLFERAVTRHLPDEFSTPAQIQRWSCATGRLYRDGMYGRRGRA